MDEFIVVNIGCIECGVSSNIVGVFDSENKAIEIARVLGKENKWREDGDNKYQVYKLPKRNVIAEEYREFLIEKKDNFFEK